MYSANTRARAPELIALLAISTVGRLTEAGRPAFFASAAIAEGVMSALPVICSSLRLSLTVLRPLTPIAIVTTPKAMRTTAATRPPISKNLRIFLSPSFHGRTVYAPSTFRAVSVQKEDSPSWRLRNRISGFPQLALAEKAALERPADELGAALDAQLPHDPSALGLHGAHREVQLTRNVSIGVTVGKQDGSHPLALGQRLLLKHALSVAADRAERIRGLPDGPPQFLRVRAELRRTTVAISANAPIRRAACTGSLRVNLLTLDEMEPHENARCDVRGRRFSASRVDQHSPPAEGLSFLVDRQQAVRGPCQCQARNRRIDHVHKPRRDAASVDQDEWTGRGLHRQAFDVAHGSDRQGDVQARRHLSLHHQRWRG